MQWQMLLSWVTTHLEPEASASHVLDGATMGTSQGAERGEPSHHQK